MSGLGWLDELAPIDTANGRAVLGTCRLCGATVRIGPHGAGLDAVRLHSDWHDRIEARLLDLEEGP